MRPSFLLSVVLALGALVACGRQEPIPEPVAPTPPPSAWLEADSHAVADELVGELLKRPWVGQFRDRTGQRPKVAVGTITDRSQGAVDVAVFTAELSRAFAAGQVTVVAAGTVPDFILGGAVGAEDAQEGGEPVKRYQIDLKLVEAKSGDPATPSLSIERKKDDKVVPPPAPSAPAGVSK